MNRLRALIEAIIEFLNIAKPIIRWLRGGKVELNKENLFKELASIDGKISEEQVWLDQCEEMIDLAPSHRERKAYLRGLRASILGLIQIADEEKQVYIPTLPESEEEKK